MWEVRSKAKSDSKRCIRCDGQRKALGKRGYEAWTPEVQDDPRVKVGSTKARWVGLTDLSFKWVCGDVTYEAVRTAILNEKPVQLVLRDLGITYKVFRSIAEEILGQTGYQKWQYGRKSSVGVLNLKVAHRNYRSLSPAGKAARLKKIYGGTCKLEANFSKALSGRGLQFCLNDWQSVPIQGRLVPREADIKVSLDKQKLVILCDGEAFHGPRFAFGDPDQRIADDIATAEGYFTLGYSVIRYSETELKCGYALTHLLACLPKLRQGRKLLRLWHPVTERWSP